MTNILTTYLYAYFAVTGLAALHFLFNWLVLKQEAFDVSLGVRGLLKNATHFQAFRSTQPFHPLYNLIAFPVAAVQLLQKGSTAPTLSHTLTIGLLWIGISLILDLLLWVVVPHPWRMTVRDLWITYQPWISLAYLAIGISPLLGLGLLNLLR